jgi:phosphate acetyltransferase
VSLYIFECAESKIYANNTKKIETSINTFEKYIDLESLSEKLSAFEAEE